MRIASLSSGSCGNCIYIGSDDHHILIDAGISKKKIEEGLARLELSPSDLDAVLITHEHGDHVNGLGVLSRKYGLPLYATEGTIDQIGTMKALGKIPNGLFHVIRAEEDFRLGDLEIQPFTVAHDAAEPVAYRINSGRRSAAVVTDLGEYDESIIAKLQQLDALLLEANHDVRMLQAGPYPYRLKRRVMGNRGHLSNEDAGRLLCELIHPGLQGVLLGHLSKQNNYEELAREAVRMEVALGGGCRGEDLPVGIAPRGALSEIMNI